MELSGDYVFDAPQELVWRALLDPNVLGAVMPGSKGFEQKGENQYAGMLEVKVGPVQGTFQGLITLTNITAPESYHIEVDGKGALGFVKATGQLHLEAQSGQTAMGYSGKAQVGGRIASVGQRLMDSAARSIIRQSLEALNEYLKVEVAKQSSPAVAVTAGSSIHEMAAASVMSQAAPAAEYKPPSQTALAMNVARDVFNDIVPRKYQPWLFGALILIVAVIILLLTSR